MELKVFAIIDVISISNLTCFSARVPSLIQGQEQQTGIKLGSS